MSFSDFLEKMQHKPRYVRTRIVWLCVIVSMSLVISVWVLTIKNSLSFNNNLNLSDDAANSLQLIKKNGGQIPSLVNSLKAGIKSLFEKTSNPNTENVNSVKPAESADKESKKEISPNQNLNNAQKIIKPKELPAAGK